MKILLFMILFSTLIFGEQAKKNSKDKTSKKPDLPFSSRDVIINQYMEMNKKLIEQFLNDDAFKDFDKHFNRVLEDIKNGEIDNVDKFFKDDFLNLLKKNDLFGGMKEGEFKWIDTPTDKILVIKIKSPKDNQIDIKIKNNQVHVSGNAEYEAFDHGEKRKFIKKFSRRFTIPRDCDPSKVKFEKKSTDILVKFAKKKEYKNFRKPVRPKKNDKSI